MAIMVIDLWDDESDESCVVVVVNKQDNDDKKEESKPAWVPTPRLEIVPVDRAERKQDIVYRR